MRWMNVGGVLEVAFRVYRLFWRPLLGVAGIAMAPILIATAALTAYSVPRLEEWARTLPPGAPPDWSNTGPLVFFFLALTAILLVQYLIVYPLLTAATIRVVSTATIGRAPSVRDAYRFAGRRFGSVLWVTLLTGLAIAAVILGTVVAGMLLAAVDEDLAWLAALLVPVALVSSFVLYTRFLLAPQVVMIENVRGGRALGRSSKLVRGKGWMVFGTYLVATILAGVASTAITTIPNQLARSGGALAQGLSGLVAAAAQIVTAPFVVSVLVFLYLDMRVRVEGLTTPWLEQDIRNREARR